jgi:hypothetical protein
MLSIFIIAEHLDMVPGRQYDTASDDDRRSSRFGELLRDSTMSR